MSQDVQAQQKEPLMGADTTDRAQSLTTRLRHANKKQHRISDGLVAGKMAIVCTDGKLYARALACFWSVHVAIEEAVAKLADLPEVRPLADLLPRLSRKKAFEEDLQFWIGDSWRSKVSQLSPYVAAYVDRIQKLTHERDGTAILAHFYTQQAAMLFGGKQLRRVVRMSLPILPDEPGTRAFEHQEDTKVLREALQSAVNGLSGVLGEPGIEKVIRERNLVFTLNNEIIRSFNVNKWNYVRGVIRIVPMEVVLAFVFVPLTFVAVWISHKYILTPEVLETNKLYTADLDAAARASGHH